MYSNLKCSLFKTFDYDFILVEGAFPQGLEANSDFSFILSPLRNPLSTQPIAVKVTTFSFLAPKRSEEFEPEMKGLIEEGSCFLEAKEMSQIQNGAIEADNETVQENSDFYVNFEVPVPVQEGSIVLITIPDDF